MSFFTDDKKKSSPVASVKSPKSGGGVFRKMFDKVMRRSASADKGGTQTPIRLSGFTEDMQLPVFTALQAADIQTFESFAEDNEVQQEPASLLSKSQDLPGRLSKKKLDQNASNESNSSRVSDISVRSVRSSSIFKMDAVGQIGSLVSDFLEELAECGNNEKMNRDELIYIHEQIPYFVGAEPFLEYYIESGGMEEVEDLDGLGPIPKIGTMPRSSQRPRQFSKIVPQSLLVRSKTDDQKFIFTYVPRHVIQHCKNIAERSKEAALSPHSEELRGASLLIADVSGFTNLNERFSKLGKSGVEKVSFHLNIYMTKLLDIVSKYGGDTIKFAGDAIIVLFHSNDGTKSPNEVALEATACALALQGEVGIYEAEGVELSLHVAVASGDLFALHVGGFEGEWEFLIAGQPFARIGAALDSSKKGDVVVSSETWELVQNHCNGELVPDSPFGAVKVSAIDYNISITRPSADTYLQEKSMPLIQCYVPKCVRIKMEAGQGKWLAELRKASVIFVNLRGLALNTFDCGDPKIPHQVLKAMQKVLKRFGGFKRQFLVDDKGSTFICVFGIPPFSHDDDTLRAVNTAIHLGSTLKLKGVEYSIGIATGNVYVGSVGNEKLRREHAVVGDTVNTAARLSGKAPPGKIYIDFPTFESTKTSFDMESRGEIKVKGKDILLKIFEPSEFNSSIAKSLKLLTNMHAPLGRDSEQKAFVMMLDNMFLPIRAVNSNQDASSEDSSSILLVIQGSNGQGKAHLIRWFRTVTTSRKIRNSYASLKESHSSTSLFLFRSLIRGILDFNSKEGELLEHKLPLALRSKSKLIQQLFYEDIDDEDEKASDLSATVDLEFLDLNQSESPKKEFGFAKKVEDLGYEIVSTYLDSNVPVCIFIENFYYSDPESVDALKSLLRKCPYRLLIVITMLPFADMPDLPNLQKVTSFVKIPVAVKMILHGFTEDTLHIMIKEKLKFTKVSSENALSELIAKIFKVTKGVPLHVIDYLNTITEEGLVKVDPSGKLIIASELHSQSIIPYSVKKAVMDKLDNMPQEDQLTCKITSLLGPYFSKDFFFLVHEFESISKQDALASLERLILQGIILREEGSFFGNSEIYHFQKDEFQKTCYELLLFRKRLDLHNSLITAVEEKKLNWIKALDVHFIYDVLGFHYFHLLKSGSVDLSTMSKAIFNVTESAKLFIEDKNDMKAAQKTCRTALNIIESSSFHDLASKTDRSRLFLLFEICLTSHIHFVIPRKLPVLFDAFESQLSKLLTLMSKIPYSAFEKLFSSYFRLWKLCFHHGMIDSASVIIEKINLDASKLDNSISPELLLDIYRMNIWFNEARGSVEVSELYYEKSILLFEKISSEISIVSKADVLGFGAFLKWSKGLGSESLKLSLMIENLYRNCSNIEIRLWSRMHAYIWKQYQGICCGNLSGYFQMLKDEADLLDLEIGARSKIIQDFASNPQGCILRPDFISNIWQSILIGQQIQTGIETARFDSILHFLKNSNSFFEFQHIFGMANVVFEILEGRVFRLSLDSKIFPSGKSALNLVHACRSKLSKCTKSPEIVKNSRIGLVVYISQELSELSKAWESWKISKRYVEPHSEFSYDELLLCFQDCLSRISDESQKPILEESLKYLQLVASISINST